MTPGYAFSATLASVMAIPMAQAVIESPLAQYGLLGTVLAYFMYQGTKLGGEIRSLAHRIDGLTRAMLMDMVNRDGVGSQTKRHAQDALNKIDAREDK